MKRDGWSGVETRHFEALNAVGAERSFAAAAERLGYTQSAISQQIAALERQVGHRLVERASGRGTVQLTDAGELLLRHARAIADRVEAARADLRGLAEGDAGVLRVGTFQSVGSKLLPELLRRFSSAWPRVDLRFTEGSDGEGLVALVERGELELTFALLPLPDGPFEAVKLLHDPYALVVGADSPLAARAVADLADLAQLELITFRSCPNERRVEDHLRAQGIEPAVVFRSDDNTTLQALVAAGHGAALMPQLSIERSDPRTAVLSLEEVVPPRVIGLAWHVERYRSRATQEFIDLAERLGAELYPDGAAAVLSRQR
jgi:DNA-binding transcriptional LysR family regulator